MLSFIYIPLLICGLFNDPKEMLWMWPVYLYAGIGILFAIGLLFLMTREST